MKKKMDCVCIVMPTNPEEFGIFAKVFLGLLYLMFVNENGL